MSVDKTRPLAGFAFAVGAFVVWGALPVYWSLLFHLPAASILCYRIFWSWAFIAVAIVLSGSWGTVRALLANRRAFLLAVSCGLLINLNWGIFIYAISTERVVEASMGYYINPLMNAIIGTLFFGERLRWMQKLAIGLAFVGVAYMVVGYGKIPVFALSLSCSFAVYGALHKLFGAGVLDGMFCEMSVAVIPACAYLAWFNTGPSFFAEPALMMLCIALSGPLTALPLMGFAIGVRRLSLATVGIIQYISPTITLLAGILYFKEPVNSALWTVFAFIWCGVLVYLFDGLVYHRFYQKHAKVVTRQ